MGLAMSITVVGSINADLVLKVRSLVAPGETILAESSDLFPGGKGANQALACSRMGGDTVFVGKVGKDSNAELALAILSDSSCRVQVSRVDKASTGLAVIMLDDAGENSIVVSPGANHSWNESDEEVEKILEGTQIVILQLEIPVDVVIRFLRVAKSMGIKTVLNPSPVHDKIRDALPLVDLLLMNKTEAEYFTGAEPNNSCEFGKRVQSLGINEAIVTLGSEGSLIFAANEITHVPAYEAEMVDTTASGDTYTGALVARLSKGDSLKDAAKYASLASSIAVGRMGAQPSIPVSHEVEARF